MSVERFLVLIVGTLGDLGVPFMLTGSLAASYHGAPRATQDIDLVVEAESELLLRFAASLREQGLYVSDEAVREASEIRGQFNAVDPASGWKADFIIRKDRPFSVAEFEDREPLRFLELEMSVVRAEDLIVAKLEWAKLGDSERQIRDAVEIVQVQAQKLDRSRIESWVVALQLESQWSQVLDALGEDEST